MYKVVVFDLDGTLIDKESSWQALHNYFEIDNKKVKENMDAFLKKKIDYKRWMELDISLWLENKPTINDVKKAFKNHSTDKNTRKTIKKLKNAGMKVYIVSSGIDILTDKISRELNVDGAYANILEVDAKGYLTGNGKCIVDPLKKDEIIKIIAKKEKVPLSSIACVGDTKYDLSMFRGVGGKIAFNSKHEELSKAADITLSGIGNVAKYLLKTG
ncbi:MAG: HAD-IB family phosphatase [Candidatus Methanofastidiosia archaeon]